MTLHHLVGPLEVSRIFASRQAGTSHPLRRLGARIRSGGGSFESVAAMCRGSAGEEAFFFLGEFLGGQQPGVAEVAEFD